MLLGLPRRGSRASKKIRPQDQNWERSSIVVMCIAINITGAVPVWCEQESTNEIVLYCFGTRASSYPTPRFVGMDRIEVGIASCNGMSGSQILSLLYKRHSSSTLGRALCNQYIYRFPNKTSCTTVQDY